jgi:hypothetical protein
VTPIVLYLRHAHYWHIQASADLSEELPKKRRRTEVSVSSIGSHGAYRQAQFQTLLFTKLDDVQPAYPRARL